MSPSRASCGISFVRILVKIDRVITAPHCICSNRKPDYVTKTPCIDKNMLVKVSQLIDMHLIIVPYSLFCTYGTNGITLLLADSKLNTFQFEIHDGAYNVFIMSEIFGCQYVLIYHIIAILYYILSTAAFSALIIIFINFPDCRKISWPVFYCMIYMIK